MGKCSTKHRKTFKLRKEVIDVINNKKITFCVSVTGVVKVYEFFNITTYITIFNALLAT